MNKIDALKEFVGGIKHPVRVYIKETNDHGFFEIGNDMLLFHYLDRKNRRRLACDGFYSGIPSFDEDGFQLVYYFNDYVTNEDLDIVFAKIPILLNLQLEVVDFETCDTKDSMEVGRQLYRNQLLPKFKEASDPEPYQKNYDRFDKALEHFGWKRN